MNLDDLVTSNSEYLKKEDVTEAGVNLTIKGFMKVKVKGDSGDEDKIALLFVEPNYKPLLLNITNKNRLKIATGETTTDGVKGKVINVFNDPYVEFGGKIVGGVRIRGVTGSDNPRIVSAAENMEDGIPF